MSKFFKIYLKEFKKNESKKSYKESKKNVKEIKDGVSSLFKEFLKNSY